MICYETKKSDLKDIDCEDIKYLTLENQMFVYVIKCHDKKTDTAIIKLYKNSDDLKCKKLFKEIEVEEWSSYF